MDINTKKLWNDGGYGLDNNYEVSIRRIRLEGVKLKVPSEIVDMILIEFFLEIEEDPNRYITEENVCSCGCHISNSGTNAIHILFERIKDKAEMLQEQIDAVMQREFNARVSNILKNQKKGRTIKWIKSAIGYGSFKPPWRT